MDEATIFRVLFWLTIAVVWGNIIGSWILRKGLREQYKAIADLYLQVALNRRADADAWIAKAKDHTLPLKDRQIAYGSASTALGNAVAFEEVARDIEHVLVNGKSFESRRTRIADNAQSRNVSHSEEFVFMSKGGEA